MHGVFLGKPKMHARWMCMPNRTKRMLSGRNMKAKILKRPSRLVELYALRMLAKSSTSVLINCWPIPSTMMISASRFLPGADLMHSSRYTGLPIDERDGRADVGGPVF